MAQTTAVSSVPECESYSSNNSSVPELTLGAESDSDMRVFALDSGTDSGHSDVQWGNPMGDIPIGMNMQVSVGISNSSENDTTELWSMLASNNESQHPSDDEISMGIVTGGDEDRVEQDGNNELAMDVRGQILRNEFAVYRDDVVLLNFIPRNGVLMERGEIQRDAELEVLDGALVG